MENYRLIFTVWVQNDTEGLSRQPSGCHYKKCPRCPNFSAPLNCTSALSIEVENRNDKYKVPFLFMFSSISGGQIASISAGGATCLMSIWITSTYSYWFPVTVSLVSNTFQKTFRWNFLLNACPLGPPMTSFLWIWSFARTAHRLCKMLASHLPAWIPYCWAFLEASSSRHGQLLIPFPTPLPFWRRGGRAENPKLLIVAGLSGGWPPTRGPHRGASLEQKILLVLLPLRSWQGVRSPVPGAGSRGHWAFVSPIDALLDSCLCSLI